MCPGHVGDANLQGHARHFQPLHVRVRAICSTGVPVVSRHVVCFQTLISMRSVFKCESVAKVACVGTVRVGISTSSTRGSCFQRVSMTATSLRQRHLREKYFSTPHSLVLLGIQTCWAYVSHNCDPLRGTLEAQLSCSFYYIAR